MECKHVQGTCRFKCPETEMELRETNGLLHKFELKDESSYRREKYPQADRNKMVKVYSRPAAGNEYNNPEMLRPPDVLLCTVQYLITSVCVRRDCAWSEVYEFVFDRLRAVRQDVVIQGVDDTSSAVSVLQTAVAFHVYSAYRLCAAPPDQYDEKINSTHTQECLKRLLCIYKDSMAHEELLKAQTTQCEVNNEGLIKSDDPVEQIQQGITNLNCDGGGDKTGQETRSQKSGQETRSQNIGQETRSKLALVCQCRQAEFVALYLLFNLGNTEALRLGMQWKSLLSKKYVFYACLEISKAWYLGNYARVLRLSEHLSPLLLCALHHHLQHVHRLCIERMSSGFSSKNLSYPLRDLTSLLHCDDDTETANLCQHYGVTVDGNKVKFLKANFKENQPPPPAKQYDWITSRLQEVPIDYLLLGDSCSCLDQYIT